MLAELGRIGSASRRFIGTVDTVTQPVAAHHEIVIEGGIGVLRAAN